MSDYGRLDQLFAEALETPSDQRGDFVRRACGDDRALRDELLSLLKAMDDSGEFMAAPALERLAERMARDGPTLRAGDRLGAYTILRLLGSGGAGQVWRAHDDRLNRDVAIKVLLPYLASDPVRIRQFVDEARLAGSLTHPNIVTVYDIGDYRDAPFIVSEYLEGETLRSRLHKGPLTGHRGVAIALKVARGLAAAHARGIIHRDLKPENVFLKSDGEVTILDFGVAKLLSASDRESHDASSTPRGLIAGTAGYMAPEQITGARADARVDLFALGVMLYEMVGGRRPFHAASTMDTLRSVLTTDPPLLATVNPGVDPTLATIVERLLEKDPDARFHSAVDLAWALERLPARLGDTRAAVATQASSTRLTVRSLAGLAAGAVLIALATWALLRARMPDQSAINPTRFVWALPTGMSLDSAPVLSPDSRRIAMSVRDESENSRIVVRALDDLEPVPVAGTEGGKQPFWSPDGRAIAFFAGGKLKRVTVDGGAPVVICDARDGRGGTWGSSGTIVFQSDTRDVGLYRVAASGGRVEPATLLDVTSPDVSHRWPVFLRDGIHFLYYVVSTDDERRGVYVASTATAASHPATRLFPSSSGPVVVSVPDGSPELVLSAEDRWIEVRTVDTNRPPSVSDVRKLDIAAVPARPLHAALLGASRDVLAFAATPIPYGAHVATVRSNGEDFRVWPEQELGGFLRLSPDGVRLARVRVHPTHSDPDVWVNDLARGGQLRVSTSRDHDVLPVWSPDGERIAYRSGTNAAPTLIVAAADGTGVVAKIPCPRQYCEPTDWSPDGALVVNVSGDDVWSVPIAGNSPPRPLLHDSFVERDARISPSGMWLAYVSNESGRAEVSVRSLSGPERRFVVSTGGGDQPVWRRDGSELFYVNPDGRLYGVSVRAAGERLQFGVPRQLAVPPFAERHWGTVYDVSSDGDRVYFPHPGKHEVPREVGVVLGWRALLK